MSCFICDAKTIDRILSHLSRTVEKFKLMTAKEIDAYGQKMVNMNYEAYFQRYSDSRDDKKLKPFKYTNNFVDVTQIQALKSLRCFLYQCSEGNVPRKKLFKELEIFSDQIAYRIVNELPEYDKAEWG